jgi:hypothetical protein
MPKRTKAFDYSASAFRVPDDAQCKRWVDALTRTGPENVRLILARLPVGVSSVGAISVGTEQTLTVGFAEEWLAWTDGQKAVAEEERQESMRRATFWAALAAGLAALGALVQAGMAIAAYYWPPAVH